MPTIRNINPIGDVDVPLLRRVVARGESVTVTEDQAARLLDQTDNWVLAELTLTEQEADANAALPIDAPTEGDSH